LIRTADFIDDILRYAYIPKDVVTVYRDYAAEERQKAKKR
jgi:hypothetical protein